MSSSNNNTHDSSSPAPVAASKRDAFTKKPAATKKAAVSKKPAITKKAAATKTGAVTKEPAATKTASAVSDRKTRAMKAKETGSSSSPSSSSPATAATGVAQQTINTANAPVPSVQTAQATKTAKARVMSVHNVLHATTKTAKTAKAPAPSRQTIQAGNAHLTAPSAQIAQHVYKNVNLPRGKTVYASDMSQIIPANHRVVQISEDGMYRISARGNYQTKTTAALDVELDKWIQGEKRKPAHWGAQCEPVSSENMNLDLELMGFGTPERETIMDKLEPVRVDGTAQICAAGYGKSVEGTGPLPPPKKKRAVKGAPQYQHLLIFEDQGWVLYDPLQPPEAEHGPPPPSIAQWATYTPGNARILMQHLTTKSVVSQTTPEIFQNRVVDYTEHGPRIARWTPIKNLNRKPAPVAPVPEPTEAPLLGRGAKRGASKVTSSEASNSSPASKAPAPPPAAAGKKRKADLLSSSPAPPPSPEAKEATPPPAKKAKTSPVPAASPPASSPPPPAPAPAPAKKAAKRKADDSTPAELESSPSPFKKARSSPVAGESAALAGEGKQKRKRRPGRPKKTPATVENSSSE